jgi:outer membrane PBP1 activator LpoA protein
MIRIAMTQYKLTFTIILLSLTCLVSGFALAETKNQTATPTTPVVKIKKSPEAYYADGLACLAKADIPCAKVAWATIPRQSAYAKLLAGNIAATENDFDSAFRLLLPLQADKNLNAEASASLHASLAQAYDNQEDPLHALEQRVMAESFLKNQDDVKASQSRIWQSLSILPKAALIEMRGNSVDTTIQGWIDFVLAASSKSDQAIADWRMVYPDHPAIAQSLITNEATTASKPLSGKIALILPYTAEAFSPASNAIERGFMAAQVKEKNSAQVKVYASNGSNDNIQKIYQQAIVEGAQYIVGPLTRDEVNEIATNELPVPTLVLNQPEDFKTVTNLYSYGLNVEAEAAQIVKIARDLGMQTATIVMSNNPLATRMAKAFSEAWTAEDGKIALPITITDTTILGTLKAELAANPTDMIFIAANAEDARSIRPYLDTATPTYGLSHLYSGIPQNPSDAPLSAIRFTDMPWVLDANNEAFSSYHRAAADLPPGEMQRWFALGVDAYYILTALVQQPLIPITIQGLTGKISINASGEISRELALGRFSNGRVVIEYLP